MLDGHSPVGSESDTHARILDAAIEQFRMSGFKGTSTRAIAERAGVNEVTLFRHFGSKLALLREAVVYTLQKIRIPEDPEPYLRLPLREGLGQFLGAYLRQVTECSDILMLGFSETFTHPEVSEVIGKTFGRVRASLIRYVQELQAAGKFREADVDTLAQILVTTMHGIAGARKRSTDGLIRSITDERVIHCLVDMVASTYGTETCKEEA